MPSWYKEHSFRQDAQVNLLQSGSEYFTALFKLIDEAETVIHLQFYIFDEDITGRMLIDKLLLAATRGVSVYLVVDGYASTKLKRETINQLRNAGIHFKQFSPIKTARFRIGRRLHQKVVLVDDTYALIGGINIADKYSGFNNESPWLDFAVMISSVFCAKDIRRICASLWSKKIRILMPSVRHTSKSISGVRTKILYNDWWRRRIEISKQYRDQLRDAKHEVIIVASYFFPNRTFRKLMKDATQRGVRIKLLISGQSDVIVLGPAVKYLYSWLLRNQIEVYEWRQSVLHGKMMLADNSWCTIGSYNINALSDYGSIEMNTLVHDERFTKHVSERIHDLMQRGAVRILPEQYNHALSLFHRFYLWICYQLIRTSLAVLFSFMQRTRTLNRMKHQP